MRKRYGPSWSGVDVVMVRKGVLLTIALCVLIFAGPVSSQTVRTVGGGPGGDQVYSMTDAHVIGTFIQHTDLAYSNGGSTIGYRQNIMAVDGETRYTRDLSLDTSNATVASPNFEAQTALTYDAAGDGNPSGTMMYDEATAVSAYGESTTGSSLSCPFGPADATLPAYSAQVVAGTSMIGVSEVALDTQASATITAASPDVPVSLNYNVNAEGIPGVGNDTFAEGSATFYMTADVKGGAGSGTATGSEISYNDVTNVNGLFDVAKQMSYSSAA